MRQINNKEVYAKYHCARWRKIRNLKIAECNGLCERCLAKGIYKEGVIVHHKEHITLENCNNDLLMYGLDNLEYLCEECHNVIHSNTDDFYFDDEGNLVKKDM